MLEAKESNINFWRYGAWGVIFLVSVMFYVKFTGEGGLTQFGGFGEKFSVNYLEEVISANTYIKPNSGGYDGQFYAQIATDPTLNNPQLDKAIDEPAYRSRRILMPLIANLLAQGNKEMAIWIYCSLNIFIWYAFAWLIWNWLKVDNAKSFARWITCVLCLGVLDSVKYSLMDLPSMAIILLLIRYASTHTLGVGASFLASIFLKETNVLTITSLPNLSGNFRSWIKEAIKWGTITSLSLCAFFLWYKYVNQRFGVFHGVSGNFDWPFSSMTRGGWIAIQEILSGNFDDRYLFRLLAILGFIFQLAWILCQCKNWKDPLIRLGFTYGFLFIFLGDLVWWGYWAVCRVALPLTIVFNLKYSPKKYFWTGLILANLTVIHSVYRFI